MSQKVTSDKRFYGYSPSRFKRYIPWCLGCSLLIAFLFSTKPLKYLSATTRPIFPAALCQPPNPNLLGLYPPSARNREFSVPSQTLQRYLSARVNKPDIDSIAVAVVTPDGTIFEHGYGVLRANETDRDKQGQVNKNSIYRIASITKVFTVLETLILRERGVLSWDDAVDKYLPELIYPSYSWSEYLNGTTANDTDHRPTISLRQLASHLSGIGRDYPPLEFDNWPREHPWANAKNTPFGEMPDFPRRSYGALLRSVAKYPLMNEPYLYPIYSNSGLDLLGLANVAANLKASNGSRGEPQTHKDLIKRDIFDPLRLKSSFYRVPHDPLLANHIAVPSRGSDFANFPFDDSDDPAGGQYSSLEDLITLMRTLLSPSAEGGVISAQVIREWLRPLYSWQSLVGTFEASGAPWEIIKAGNSRLYTKGGNLPGYHSEFAVHQELSFGVIVLLTGSFTDTTSIVQRVVSLYQPAFENILQHQMSRLYEGAWGTGNVGDLAVVKRVNGALYLTSLYVHGIDVLGLVQDANIGAVKKSESVALWSTGRTGEFRLAFGRKELNRSPSMGCFPYWISIDFGLNSRGAPIDLIYWEGEALVYPSAGVRFRRIWPS